MFSRNIVLAAIAATALAAPAVAQDFNAAPNYRTINLRGGFAQDPNVTNLRAGGNLDASRVVRSDCRGFITNRPDVRLNWTGGSLPLIISVQSDSDTTLVINDAQGNWVCDDDGGNEGLNPSVTFVAPASGQYDIWVGTFSTGSLQPSTLHVSELYSQ